MNIIAINPVGEFSRWKAFVSSDMNLNEPPNHPCAFPPRSACAYSSATKALPKSTRPIMY